jgi:predicted transcriptional regulator
LAVLQSHFQFIKIWLNLVNSRITGYIEARGYPPYTQMSGSPSSYRDRIYIVKDVILKLVEYGELNQTALVSFCGLNMKKHKSILDDLEANGLIERIETNVGKRSITMCRPTQQGIVFCHDILEAYERMFPRRKQNIATDGKNHLMLLLV